MKVPEQSELHYLKSEKESQRLVGSATKTKKLTSLKKNDTYI